MPTLTVVGNCQAESTRRLLMSTGQFESERIPPVHELAASDMGWFGELISRTDVLITQPIRDGYRHLPVGTAELSAQLPSGAHRVVVPVLRFDGLMPYQAIIRDPDDSSLNPPVVSYHDLRTLAGAYKGLDAPVEASPSPSALRDAAAMSIEQIRVREQRHGCVVMSDYLETTPVWHTVNHPDNATLQVLAERILSALGALGSVETPEYEMLGELDAPIDPDSARALGVTIEGRSEWTHRLNGVIDGENIIAQQLAFYAARPALVAHGITRHAQRLANLGLI